jgi:multicomponent Na+:H+ antiporter subunit E
MSVASARRILVPVGDSVTVRNTVAYVVREFGETGESDADGEAGPEGKPEAGAGVGTGAAGERELHFVFPVAWQNRDLNAEEAGEAEDLLDRVRAWVREDLDLGEDEEFPVEVRTTVIGADEYLFSPRDYAETILEYAREGGVEHIVLDPEFKPGGRAPLLAPLEAELDLAGDITHETAPVERPVRGRRLLGRTADAGAVATVFGTCFLFYQVLGGFAGTFDYVTGAVSAAITAAVFSGITFDRGIRPAGALRTTARWLVYVPYLFWEIAKANLQVAYIVLHPSLPIDPSMEEFSPAVPLGLPVTSLANSITLTPGTVTVEVRERHFYVHALTQSARDGIYDGGLERAIRFVFFGRDAARIPGPRERGQTEDHRPEDPSAESTDPAEQRDGKGGGST